MQPDVQPCYLCGEPLADGRPVNADHVPPKQFFPASYLRAGIVKDLKTIEVHASCNGAYGADEQYFVQSIGPIAHGTTVGTALVDDNIMPAIRRPSYGPRISQRVLGEFTEQVNGIWLPPGKVAKRFDTVRIYRVIAKIVRGLYFAEAGIVLPVDHFFAYPRIWSPEDQPNTPEEAKTVAEITKNPPGDRNFGDVFCYWRDQRPIAGTTFHNWMLLFWNCALFWVMFHEPGCACDACERRKAREVASQSPY